MLAGAGSGKTRVLTHRIACLLRTSRARADEILAITFTNKAAQEMRERVELLVGRATRAMWLMTFHSACARMLRAEAHRLGYTRQFTIYDAADSAPDDQEGHRRPGHRPQALHAACHAGADLGRQEQAALGRGLPPDGRLLLRADGGRRLRAVRARAAPRERHGLRRPARARGQRPRALPGGARPLRRRRSAGSCRRVPGHQPRPVPLAPAPVLRAPQPDGGRRRRPVDLRLPRSGHHETSSSSRTTSPTRTSSGSSRTTARRRRS